MRSESGNALSKRESTAQSRIGERFGMLTIIGWKWSLIRDGSRRAIIYRCKCDCSGSKIKNVESYTDLTSKKLQTCGCKRIFTDARCTPDKAYELLYAHWVRKAKESLRDSDLPEIVLPAHEWRQIVMSKCFYCDEPPTDKNPYGRKDGSYKRFKRRMKREYLESLWVPVQGIDRFINKLPYNSGNCLPCCKICNFLKKAIDGPAFICKLRKIALIADRTTRADELST